jgi:aminoacrylate peracid reductase
MPRTPIIPKDSPPPLAPYSPAVRAGDTVYVSGLLPIDPQGQLVGANDVKAQTRCILGALKGILEAAGGSLEDVVHNAIFLRDLSDYAAMNAVYGEHFAGPPPARYCIRADLVRPEFLVEISSVAHIPNGNPPTDGG